MQKRFSLVTILLLAFVGLFSGCAKEEAEEVPRQLFVSTYKIGKKEVSSPAWFDPATGEVTYLCSHCPHECLGDNGHCSEEVHRDACPFAGFFSARYQVIGDTLYYFASNEDYGNLHAYSLTSGETTHLLDTAPNTLWRSSTLFRGEYLYQFDASRERNFLYENMQRLHLPTGEWEDLDGQPLPFAIEDGVGFYTLADSDEHYITGIYSQPLYKTGETPPPKTLLLHEVDIGIFLKLTEDAIYWFGNDQLPQDANDVHSDLYRYDRQTQEITLLVQNYGSSQLVDYGESLYGIRKDGTRTVLMQIHATDGTQKVLYTAEEGWTLHPASVDLVENYVIVDANSENGKAKVVYDIVSGESMFYKIR